MNRRMRNRTYGGVRGRRGQLRPLLDGTARCRFAAVLALRYLAILGICALFTACGQMASEHAACRVDSRRMRHEMLQSGEASWYSATFQGLGKGWQHAPEQALCRYWKNRCCPAGSAGCPASRSSGVRDAPCMTLPTRRFACEADAARQSGARCVPHDARNVR